MKEHEHPAVVEEHTILRVCREYLDMPGMWLTRRQAQRLFGLPEHVCSRLLDALVRRRFLSRRPNGMYGRTAEGRTDLEHIVRGMQREGLVKSA